MQLINKENVISGNNFSKYADVVFSERVSSLNYPTLKKGHFYKIIEEVENNYSSDVWFINKQFTLRKNSTIFCKTEALELLFLLLKKIPKEYELNLITHQSDITITEKKYKNKPRCIKEWYAVNVSYANDHIHQIPLGISENFRKKHLSTDYLDEMLENTISDSEKKHLIYINYNQNTNERIRSKIFKKLRKSNFINLGLYGLEIQDYINDLKNNEYVLCPTGNGIDTYRLWETLIVGSNPVVNSVDNHLEFRNLPIYYFDKTEELDLDYLSTKKDLINNLKNNNIDRRYLTTSYWMDSLSKAQNIESSLSDINIIIDENLEKKYFRKFFFLKNLKSNFKIFRYYVFQYLNILNYLKFLFRKLKIKEN